MTIMSLNLRFILDNNKVTGPNFLDWLLNLMIVLKSKKLRYVLKAPIPHLPTIDVQDTNHKVYQKLVEDSDLVAYVMLASMAPKLLKQHEVMDAYTIIFHLGEIF